MFNQILIWRVRDHGFFVIESERHLGGGSVLTWEHNDGYGGQNVDMVARQILFAARPAVWKVCVDGQLHILIRIAVLGFRTFSLTETRDNADTNASVFGALHKCSTDRCHYPSPATGEKIHPEASEKFADVSTKSVV